MKVVELPTPSYLYAVERVFVEVGLDDRTVEAFEYTEGFDTEGLPDASGFRLIVYRGRKPESGIRLALRPGTVAILTPVGMHEAWWVSLRVDGRLTQTFRTESAVEFIAKGVAE